MRVLTGYPDAPEDERLNLGVVWYYNRDVPNADLDTKKMKGSWGDLYCTLQELRYAERRTVAHVQESGILPANTNYYGAPVDRQFDDQQRVQYRYHDARYAWNATPDDWLDGWMKGALSCSANAQLVILDPDNGLAGPCIGNQTDLMPWHQNGTKYAFISDVQSFLYEDKSLVIYHHLGRHKGKESQIKCLAKNIQKVLDKGRKPFPKLRSLWFHPERASFIIAQKDHQDLLWDRLDSLLETAWGKPPNPHFEEILLS